MSELLGQTRFWAQESLQICRGEKQAATAKSPQYWRRPTGDVLKVNSDGSFQESSRRGGRGFIIRDCDGTVRGSGAGKILQAASAAQVEAIACEAAAVAA